MPKDIQDFFKWRVVFEGPQDSLPDLSESYQNWVPEWDVETLVRKHHLFRHLLKSAEDNSKPTEMNLWMKTWGTKVASSVRCWTSQEMFPTILQRWSSALRSSGPGCYGCYPFVTVVTLSTLQIAGIAAFCRVRFETEMWHPNIYPDGRVCISSLYPPGADRFNDQAKPWWEVSAGAARLTQVSICFPSGNRWWAVATYPGSSQHFDQCATLRCPLKLAELKNVHLDSGYMIVDSSRFCFLRWLFHGLVGVF